MRSTFHCWCGTELATNQRQSFPWTPVQYRLQMQFVTVLKKQPLQMHFVIGLEWTLMWVHLFFTSIRLVPMMPAIIDAVWIIALIVHNIFLFVLTFRVSSHFFLLMFFTFFHTFTLSFLTLCFSTSFFLAVHLFSHSFLPSFFLSFPLFSLTNFRFSIFSLFQLRFHLFFLNSLSVLIFLLLSFLILLLVCSLFSMFSLFPFLLPLPTTFTYFRFLFFFFPAQPKFELVGLGDS